MPPDKVRVIVPDFGGGFGGKHTGECAVEAARLAKEAGKPVHLQWTRAEEFTWAYFRPSALVKAEASFDSDGKIATLVLHEHQCRSIGIANAVSRGQPARAIGSGRIAAAARFVPRAWAAPATRSHANVLWTNWPRRRAKIRWSFAWRI